MLANETIRALPKMPLPFLRGLLADYLASPHVDYADIAWVDRAISDKEKRNAKRAQVSA